MRHRDVLCCWAVFSGVLSSSVLPARAESKPSFGPILFNMPGERVAEQGILTPVPINIRTPASMPARRVLVHYRTWGSTGWTTLELLRVGGRWSGAIPCMEVSTITGELVYYIRVHDIEGAVIAFSGSRQKPYRVRILHDSVRPENELDSARCPDPADCPPGLLGCPSEPVEEIPCQSDSDCEDGVCGWFGVCEAVDRRKNWLGIEIEQDLAIVPTAGACALASQENEGYACARQFDGTPYFGNPVALNGPLMAGVSNTRVVVGYERAIFYNTSLGVRLGYAVAGSGPSRLPVNDLLPYSAEVRASYWFHEDPFARSGLSPYVSATAGFAMFDVEVPVDVREDVTRPPRQGGNDLEQTLDVWRRGGDGFVGFGLGLKATLPGHWAATLECQVAQAFPFTTTALISRGGLSAGF